MAKLKKIQSGAKSSFIWMGTCDNEECEDFDLTSWADDGSNAGAISSVFQMGDNNIAGVWKSDNVSFLNDLNDGSTDNNKMLCGKNYFIKLHPATSGADETEIEIPGAIFDYKGQAEKGRVFNKDSAKPQFLGDVSNLPSCIAKGEFKNLITDSEIGEEYPTDQTITPDKDGIYVKGDGTVHRIFSGKPFNIPAGSKLFKGNFGSIDTDGDGTPDIHDTEPSVSDRETYTGGGDSSTPIGPIDQDTLLESFKITLPNRPWTDLEFFWDPLTVKYNNRESNYDDWYIALDSASNTWKTYVIYDNEPAEADEISASINILNTNTGIIISDAVHFESPALPKSFSVIGGDDIDNNAQGTYTLVFNSNSDFYYTNNDSSVEHQIKYDYDAKNWQAFSIHPINGSETFYKNVTNSGVKFLTEIVANEVIEMGSDLQRTYLNPDYASNAQTQDETITFNGRSLMTSDWTANSFVMPDCAKSLSQSYQFIPDSTGDFNLQRKQVASYYSVPPRNRSEFYKELAPGIHLSTFGIPLGFGNWDHSNFTTTLTNYSDKLPESSDLCPAPHGRNKIRFEVQFSNPDTGVVVKPVLDFAWDHYYKRYTARDMPSQTDQDNNTPFASAGSGIGAISEYETLIIPTSTNAITREFWGWFAVTEGSGGTSVSWSTGLATATSIVLFQTWFPSHAGDLPDAYLANLTINSTSTAAYKTYLNRITELSDHPTYSAENNYLDSLFATTQQMATIHGIPGGFTIAGGTYAGTYGPVPGNTVDGLPIYQLYGVRTIGIPVFYAQTYSTTIRPDVNTNTIWVFLGQLPSTFWWPDGHILSSDHQIGSNTSGDYTSPDSRPWEHVGWSFGMNTLTPT